MAEEALKDYSKAIELDPENTYGYEQRIDLYKKQEKTELLLKDYGKCQVLNVKILRIENRKNVVLL